LQSCNSHPFNIVHCAIVGCHIQLTNVYSFHIYLALSLLLNFAYCWILITCYWMWMVSAYKLLSLPSTLFCWIFMYHHHKCFTALFPGPPGWAGARRELLDFMVQEKINRGRHTDHPAGRHSIWTNQCPAPPSSPYFLQAGCPSCRPTNSVKALKATSTFGLGRRR